VTVKLWLVSSNDGISRIVVGGWADNEVDRAFLSIDEAELELKLYSAADDETSKAPILSGLGSSGHSPTFDISAIPEDIRPIKLLSHFAADVSLDCTRLAQIACCLDSYVAFADGNNEEDNTRCGHLAALAKLFPWLRIRSGSDLSGECESKFVSDGYFVDDNRLIRGWISMKNGASVPAEALRQMCGDGSSAALVLYQRGVEARDIMVPMVAGNGFLLQFGLIHVLEPSFPAYLSISRALDLTDTDDLNEAARLLACIERYLAGPLPMSSAPRPQNLRRVLNPLRYHCKPLEQFFTSTGNRQSSLRHYFRLMSHLFRDPKCRAVVVFPLCVREYEDRNVDSVIVFPNMSEYNYWTGLPENCTWRRRFMYKLKSAVQAIHAAGVAHLDLFLSNIMWRPIDHCDVDVKIIDWDAAVFLNQPLSAVMKTKLAKALLRTRAQEKCMADDGVISTASDSDRLKYYDISVVRAVEQFQDERSLQSDWKEDLDIACWRILHDYVGK
jgi:hypothetical protein